MGQQSDSTVYQSVFGDSVARWYETEGWGCAEVYDVFADDTVRVDGILYKRWRKMDNEGDCLFGHDFPIFLFRESARHDKVYARRMNSSSNISSEKLIMDLDLDVGETLEGMRAIEVDSVFMREGRKILRTKYYIESATMLRTDTLYFMEGIGPSFGMTYAFKIPVDWFLSLICYYRDDIFVYHNADYYNYGFGDCLVWWIEDGIDESDVDGKGFVLFPNPTTGIMNVKLPSTGTYKLKIISTLGMKYYEKIFQGEEIQLNIKELPQGIYNIIVEGETASMKKMIKL